MVYARQSNVRDDLQITGKLNSRQENNSGAVKKQPQSPFGVRLLKAFRDAKLAKNQVEIAKLLGVQNSTVTGWMQGSYPQLDLLIEISAKTKCSIHWLLTGEGEASVDRLKFLGPNERVIVERMAHEENRPDEEVASALIVEALTQRASGIFNHMSLTGRITEHERQQLILLYNLVLDQPFPDPQHNN